MSYDATKAPEGVKFPDDSDVKFRSNGVSTYLWSESPEGVLKMGFKGLNPIYLDTRSAHQECQTQAAHLGWQQKLSGIISDPAEQKSPLADRRDKAIAFATRISSGSNQWSDRVTKEVERVEILDPIAIAAVAVASGKSITEVEKLVRDGAKAFLESPSDYLIRARSGKKVKPIYDKMLREKFEASKADDFIGSLNV